MTNSRVLQENPINFALYYEGDINLYTIYLDDGYPALPLYLKIFNSNIHQIELAAPGTDDERKTKAGCHFYMTFPRGVLNLDGSETILSDDNWKAFYVAASGGRGRGAGNSTDTIYFSRNTTQTIEGESSQNQDLSDIVLTLSNIQAASGVETRSSEVGLHYGGKTAYKAPKASAIANIELANHGYDHTLFIINHYGKKKIPLHVGFAGSNTILNDGQTPNQLQLQITNIQNQNNPRPNLAIGKDSRFIIRFDEGDLTKEWALAEPDKVQGIAVAAVDNTKWEVNRDDNGSDWIITPKKNPDGTLIAATLDLGKSIDLNITNITSAHPSGQTKLTVRYEEIPDYWDGDLVCLIEKTPLMFRSPLKATANNQVLTAVRIKTNFDDHGKSGVKHVGLAVETGNVGIGTTAPNYKLDVNGNTNVNGTIYRGGNPLSYENYEIYLRGSSYQSSEGDDNYLKIANVSIPMTRVRGINTVILNPNGTYKTGTSHDVYGNAERWNDWADWINDTSNVANGDVVAVASHDSILCAPSDDGSAKTLLTSINALKAFSSYCGYRTSYALLFIKGKAGAIEITQPDQGLNAHLKTTYYELSNYGNSSVVLTGMIVMWSGNTDEIPVGWALCDGTNDTPNLTDRFIVGAGSSYQVNAQGGNKNMTLSKDQMPKHSHGVDDPGHFHKMKGSYYNVSCGDQHGKHWWGGEGRETSTATTGISIEEEGRGQPFDNRPPYLALCFIMKT